MTKVCEIKVNLGNRTYPIYIGNDLFSSFEKLIEGFSKYSKLIVVTDNHVKKLINERIFLLKKRCDKSVSIICLPSGENSKSFKYFEFLCEKILEKKILYRLLESKNNLVISTGAGILGDQKTIDSIKEKSICIFLEIKINNLVQRLTNNLKSRPLLKNVDLKEKLESMINSRTKKYEQAHIIISVDGLTIPDIVRRIINNLKYHGKN